MERFLTALLRNRRIVVFFMLLIALAGLLAYYMIPKQENPNAVVAAALITTVYPGASPEDVEQFVTNKLEDAIMALDDIQYTASMSMESASVITVMYDDDILIEDVETKLRQTVSDVQADLPGTCMASTVRTDLVSDNAFIISLSGEGYTPQDLEAYADSVRTRLEQVDGIASVTVAGQQVRQVVVEADIEQLRLYGVSIENLLGLLQAQNLSIPSGSIAYDSGSVTVSTPALFENLADIENLVVGGADDSLSFVKLKDVANVYIERADDYYYLQDGQDAVLLVGRIEEGRNAVNVGRSLRRALDDARADMPENLTFHEVMYAPEAIESNINGFIVNLLESVLLIMLVVLVGVQLRNALVISVALPMSILITFIVMWILGIEFQFVSIAALIVSLGILVDNAIVISEAIQQNLNAGAERTAAIVDAVRTTAVPVLTSTLTTVVTFSVIYFVPGTVGKVAGTIPTVVIAALTASYFVAMLGIPVLAYTFFKPEKQARAERESALRRLFMRVSELAMRAPRRTLALAFSTLGVAVVLALGLGLQFFPYASKPVMYINIEGEAMSLSATDRLVDEIEEVLRGEPLVEHTTACVGQGLPSFFLTVPTLAPAFNNAQIMLQLNEEEYARYSEPEAAMRELQAKLDAAVPGAKIQVKCLEYSMPTDATITLTVSGSDTNQINALAQQMRETLATIPGTDNVRDTAVVPQYQYRVVLDSERLSGYGLLKYDVAKQLNTSLMGATASSYTANGSEMDIVVRANVASLDDLLALPISASQAGTRVLLGQVAEVELQPTVPQINHYNGRRSVNVLSGVLPGYAAARIESQLNAELLDQLDLGDMTVTERGETANMLALIQNLGVAALLAVLVIYVILLLQFRDFAKPVNVLTSIPLSLIGCCFGLWLFHMDIQVMALLGLVSLFGIVVNNGILLIEVIDAERAAGAGIRDACREAVRQRFRPIMLSSITTCIGLVPLVASGDAMTAPMASVLLFGLLGSTVLTLAVVPALYTLREEKRENRQPPPAKS